jgi:hypothetical protein
MSNRIVFFNTGWMDFYKGLSNDTITGGGKYVDSMGWGGEMLNFKPFSGHLFGYVQPKIDRKYDNPSTIKLEKIGATEDDEKFDNVTVVWTATDPDNGGTYITGWYKNATVFRYYQDPPTNSKRRYKNNPLGYFVTTKVKDARLLPVDERIVQVQRQKKNWMGQSNVWYADNNPEFVKTIKDYIFKGIIPPKVKDGAKGKGGARQLDPLKRIEVEKKAVLFVTKYYKSIGYEIQSFEKDNVGWDLTATNNKTELKLEVKGLSGANISTELTPNEFKNLKADKIFYRLCIVTNTLTKPNLKVFAHSKDNNEWTSEDGTVIRFQEVVSARIYV